MGKMTLTVTLPIVLQMCKAMGIFFVQTDASHNLQKYFSIDAYSFQIFVTFYNQMCNMKR